MIPANALVKRDGIEYQVLGLDGNNFVVYRPSNGMEYDICFKTGVPEPRRHVVVDPQLSAAESRALVTVKARATLGMEPTLAEWKAKAKVRGARNLEGKVIQHVGKKGRPPAALPSTNYQQYGYDASPLLIAFFRKEEVDKIYKGANALWGSVPELDEIKTFKLNYLSGGYTYHGWKDAEGNGPTLEEVICYLMQAYVDRDESAVTKCTGEVDDRQEV